MSSGDDDAHRLQAIADAFYGGQATHAQSQSAVIDVVLDRLRCDRVSLWKFEGQAGALRLLCHAAKRSGEDLDGAPHRLSTDEYRDYFNGLINRGVYVSDDALVDPALAAMRESYLTANGIVSMLDAAFVVNGRAFGMVCCEETGRRRHWEATDVAALRKIVNKLAMLMARADDRCLWDTPSLPLREISPPRPVRNP